MTQAFTACGTAEAGNRGWGLGARENPELGAGDWGLGRTPQNPAPSPQHPAPNSSPEYPAASAAAREVVGCELAAEVVRSFGKLRLRVTGGSMLPALWPGDILSVSGRDVGESLPGDIVVFRREGMLVTHRVVERSISENQIQWVTRGDRVGQNDPPVSSHDILGRVTTIERGSRLFTPQQSFASRFASWIFSKSDFATGVVLKLRG